MKLMRSCEEASRLMSRALDEPLGLLDRTLLQLHLSMCGNCRHVDQQLRAIEALSQDLFTDEVPAGQASGRSSGG